ncbi:hypothetical protein ACPCSG_16180 [Streptomyces cellulosae]
MTTSPRTGSAPMEEEPPAPAPPGAEEDLEEEEGLSLDALPSAWTA